MDTMTTTTTAPDAALLEALEDIIEQSAIGNFDATEIARAAIAAAKGANQ